MNESVINLQTNFCAPCGCVVRHDGDGLMRLAFCRLHAHAQDMKEALMGVKIQLESETPNVENALKRISYLNL